MSARDLLDEALTKLDEAVAAHSTTCECSHRLSTHGHKRGRCVHWVSCGCASWKAHGDEGEDAVQVGAASSPENEEVREQKESGNG